MVEPLPRTFELPGATLAVHVQPAPAGLPVVLLHPWFGCWQFWSRTLAALPELPCYAVDLYSLGLGEGWRRYASPVGLADAVVGFLDAAGIERCALVGNSMGGIAALALAAEHPARVESLVLVGTGASADGLKPDYRAEVDRWLDADPDRSRVQALTSQLLSREPPAEDLAVYGAAVKAASRDLMITVLKGAIDLDLRPRLPAITARTLVVRGELDAGRTQEHVDDLVRGIPDSRAVEIPGAGHSPMVDSPGAFNRLLREFLLGPQ